MMITWNGGSLTLEDAWIENKTDVEINSRRTITGDVIVFLPAEKQYKIVINTCSFEEAMVLKTLAEGGISIQIDDEGFVVKGKIKKIQIRHFITEIKEPAIRQRANIYRGYFILESEA